MTKPMVERYEQILAQDPASTVFVELAKALIEKGEHHKAIEVCKGGLGHHRESVAARVLWGKALINLGRPAEAMEQFDLAIAIDKENAHAYNLIGEVLLHKGLYRSALPLLKKAVALQPNDGRVRQWLEQTQRALSGGPAPVLTDLTLIDPLDPQSVTTDPGQEAKRSDISADSTEVLKALSPEVGRDEDPTAEIPLPQMPGATDPAATTTPLDTPAQERPADPFDVVAARSKPVEETVGGMTAMFDALSQQTQSEPTIIPARDLYLEGKVERSGPVEIPSDEVAVAPTQPAKSSGGLLDDVPDYIDYTGQMQVVKAEVSTQTTEAIAKEYERELRQKLAVSAARKTFWQRHWVKLAVTVVAGVVLAASAGAYFYTRAKNQGKDLADALADAKLAIAQDTGASYKTALESLGHAVQMDADSPEAWSLSAYAHAVLYAEHGRGKNDQMKALVALSKPKVRERFPGLTLAADYYLADDSQRAEAEKAVLSSSLDQTEVHEVAGRVLLSKRKTDDGLKRLGRALELLPANVRALVALGDYYREAQDDDNALKFYAGPAAQVSAKHAGRVVGAAEVRLERQVDLAEALEELEALPKDEPLLPDLEARRTLALGRALTANGRHADALKTLQQGVTAHKAKAFPFQMALGEAYRAAGDIAEAHTAFEAAVKLSPRSEDAREALGRVLLARAREREVLRISTEGEARRVHLVRGIAYTRLGEWKRARSELSRTQVNGKFPTEAVVHLALVDAAEGDEAKAEQVLEKVLASVKRGKADVRVALGQVYWRQGVLAKARKQFEEAAKDPGDFEGSCALGRLILEELKEPEKAIGPLTKAIEKNAAHPEARQALGRAYLAVGRIQDALAQAEAWQLEDPDSAEAQTAFAFALYHSGRFKEAEAVSAKAVRVKGSSAEAHRVRAMVAFANADGRAGFASLERANKLDPKDAATFCEIGQAFMRQGASEMAEKAYQAAVREDPASACGAIGAHYARLPRGGRSAVKELAELAKKALQSHDRAFAWATLARVRLVTGPLKEAKAAAEKAVGLAPYSGLAQLSAGLVALRQKDGARAVEVLSKAVEYDGTLGAAQLALGDALQQANETERAVKAYENFLKVGGSEADVARVKKVLANLKKKLAQR
ncbi:MAG: tetratricopeptide repeat protein [Myxococcota bacterium]